jgi:DNA-binding MurR/RpiR family transcriptional regulator
MARHGRLNGNVSGMPESLKSKILEAYQRLPANQQRVADFILKQPHDLAFLTTESLSKTLKVSKATIVRFAQSLQYQGFTELQNQVLDAVQSTIRAPDRYMVAIGKMKPDETLTLVAQHEVHNIDRTVHYIDRETFSAAVDVLVAARRVHTMGVGVSSLLSEVLSYELNQVGIESQALASGKIRFVEHLALARKGDVVVGFSFRPYSKETVDAAKYARQRGLNVIAVTDKLTSPITFHAQHVLAVQTENMLHTNSISAISVVINALVTDVALKNKSAASRMFRESTQILQQTDEYIEKREHEKR